MVLWSYWTVRRRVMAVKNEPNQQPHGDPEQYHFPEVPGTLNKQNSLYCLEVHGKRVRKSVKCVQCDVFICSAPCFRLFHEEKVGPLSAEFRKRAASSLQQHKRQRKEEVSGDESSDCDL